MNEIKKLFTQSSHYFYAQIITMVTHLVSFPILTRLLSISDYGYLGLLTSTIFLMIALSKSGLQNSFVRFYSDYIDNKKRPDIYYTTFFFGPLLISLMVVMLYLAVIHLLSYFLLVEERLVKLLFLISFIILCKGIYMLFMSFWRAEQRTKIYNGFLVFATYLNLIFGIIFLLFFSKNLEGLLIGYLVAEIISSTIIFYLLFRDYGNHIKLRSFSIPFFKESLFYGLPLLGMEFTNFMLTCGDRYMIIYLMNSEALGLYSAASNLSSSAASCLTFPITFAIVPLIIKTWTTQGKKNTQQFLARSLKYFFMIALPIIFGIIAIGKYLLAFLAGTKYLSSYMIIPYITTGTIIFGMSNIFNAGLLIKKKSIILMLLTIGAGLVNVVLNFILIKAMGILGAAVATFISYAVLLLSITAFSFKYLSFTVDFFSLARYLVYSLIMYMGINFIDTGHPLINLVLKILLGIIIYAFLIFSLEYEIRENILSRLSLSLGIFAKRVTLKRGVEG